MNIIFFSKKISLRIALTLLTISILAAHAGISSAATDDTANSHADSLMLAKKYFSFAVQFKDIGNVEEAHRNYDRSIAFNDSVYQVHYSYADFLNKQGLKDEARREYRYVLALNPDHFNSAVMLAHFYTETAHYDSALTMYEIMHRLKPEKTELLISIISLNEYLKRPQKALDGYESLLQQDALKDDMPLKAGKLAVSLKDWPRAIEFGNYLLKQVPDSKEAAAILTNAYIATGEEHKAFDIIAERAQQDEIDFDCLAAIEKKARDNNDNAFLRDILDLKLQAVKNDTGIHGELAEICLRAGENTKAQEYISCGLDIDPEDGKLNILRGNILENEGKEDEAIKAYTVALKDKDWQDDAQQFIWRLRPPKSEEEKAEMEFFKRGKTQNRSVDKNKNSQDTGR